MIRMQNNKNNEDNRPPTTSPTHGGNKKRTTNYSSLKEDETEVACTSKPKLNKIMSSPTF